MTRQTLLLFVDAFRRDYLPRTQFLRSLAATSRVGTMREYFGFLPQAGYFGGLGPSDTGFTNMYCCDPAASPFGLARGVPDWSSTGGHDRFGVRAWLDAEAAKRTTPFAATYVSSSQIPLPLLPWFDVVEKQAAWHHAAGYRSVFHELTDRGDRFFCCAWPETNRLADHSDAALVRKTLDEVAPDHRLVFLHLQELDALGHAYGPESSEINKAIKQTDARVATVVRELAARVDDLDLVVFSDHGMVSVTGTVDVSSAIASTGLVAGRDFVMFLDSTMARFWFPTDVARPVIVKALSALPGRVLGLRDLRRLDIDGCDPRNGELYFLAEPGHVIIPNFFQATADHTRGMHGCEPDCPDNMGIFMVRSGRATAATVDLGIVGPTAVYHALRDSLELPAAPNRPASTLAPVSIAQREFTQHPDPGADAAIRGHMRRIVDDTLRIVPGATILLTGSFGRGEGGVRLEPDGVFVPVNDYDILVVAPDASPADADALQVLGEQLAAEFRTDFVHFSIWRDLQQAIAPSMANFDLRYGSRILHGSEDALDSLPEMAAADIPDLDGLQLLYNRLGGILTGLKSPDDTAVMNARERGYLINQVMKARIALGDWRLVRARAYDVSYRKRRERFSWLASGMLVDATERDAIVAGYDFKLQPEHADLADPSAAAAQAAAWLVSAIVRATAALTRRPVGTAAEASALYRDIMSAADSAVRRDNEYASRQLRSNAHVRVRSNVSDWVRSAIYGSFPLVAAAAAGDGDAFVRACDRLDACLTPPWPRTLTPENWELVRRRLSHAWLALVS